MEVDFDKVFRVGVDKITLHGFEILHANEDSKKRGKKKNSSLEIIEKELEGIRLYAEFEMFSSGQITKWNKITFNPNRVLSGYNVQNSRAEELKESIKIIEKIYEEHDVKLDFTNAEISEIEINKNFEITFDNYFEVFLFFFKQLPMSKGTFGITDSEKLNEMTKQESFFNRSRKTWSVRAYDKRKELRDKYKKSIDRNVTRIEYNFKISAIRRHFKRIGIGTSLRDLIENIEIIDNIFKYSVREHFLVNASKIIDNIKKVLNREYINFKNANRLAKATKRKQEYNVYKYLDSWWVFDKSFVIEIVSIMDKKNKIREIKKINRYIRHRDNLKKFNFLVENFLSSDFSKSEEN